MEQLSPCPPTTEPVLESPAITPTEASAPTREGTAVSSLRTTIESSPCSLQLEKSLHSNEDPAQPKYKNN